MVSKASSSQTKNYFCLRSLGGTCKPEVMCKWAPADSQIPEKKALRAVTSVVKGLHENFSSVQFRASTLLSLHP